MTDTDRERPLIGVASTPDLHVMTYNLKVASGGAPHSWWTRRPLVTALVSRERPTVLCTQEGRFRQLVELHDGLDGYDWLHFGARGGSRGESTAIFWESERLTPLEYDHQWISRRPSVPETRAWGSSLPRMLTWIRFADKKTGTEFSVVDNHLDHRSDRARRKGALMNAALAERLGSPVIIAGDFNCAPGSKPYATLTGAGLDDAWEAAEKRLTPAWGTFNNWKTAPVEGGKRIDWILVRPETEVLAAAVNTHAEGDLTPSDHWPVQALLRLN